MSEIETVPALRCRLQRAEHEVRHLRDRLRETEHRLALAEASARSSWKDFRALTHQPTKRL